MAIGVREMADRDMIYQVALSGPQRGIIAEKILMQIMHIDSGEQECSGRRISLGS